MAKNKSNKFGKFARTGLLALSATMFAGGVGMLGVCGSRLSTVEVKPVPYSNVIEDEGSKFVRYTAENISQLFASYPGLEDLIIIDSENGLTFRSGTVDPDNSLGVLGDTYLNSSSKYLFRKIKTGWMKVGSISEGTESNPVIISSVEDFLGMLSYEEGTYFKLNNDLDFRSVDASDSYFITETFNGTIDGGGHTIYMSNSGVSMFSDVNGVVKDLTLEYGHVENYSTSFAWLSTQGIRFESVTTNGIVQASSDNTAKNYSPFIGHLYESSSFINCTNNVDISGVKYGSAFVGGYIPRNGRPVANKDGTDRSGTEGFMNGVEIEFINCVNNGDLTMLTASMLWGNSTVIPLLKNLTVEGCVNNGKIIGTEQAGLFCGMYNDGGAANADHMEGLKEINDEVETLISGDGECFVNSLDGFSLRLEPLYSDLELTVPSWTDYTYKLALNCMMFKGVGDTVQFTATFNITQSDLTKLNPDGLSGTLPYRRWKYIDQEYADSLDMTKFVKIKMEYDLLSFEAEFYGVELYLFYNSTEDKGFYCFMSDNSDNVFTITDQGYTTASYKDISIVAYDANGKAVGQAIVLKDQK